MRQTTLPRTITRWLLKAGLAAAFVTTALLARAANAPQRDAVTVEASPKVFVVLLDFNGPDDVSLISADLFYGSAPMLFANPPFLHITIQDSLNHVISEFNEWHPLLAERETAGGHLEDFLLPRATGRFVFPFAAESVQKAPLPTTMTVRDQNQVLVIVDLLPAILDFCQENSGDPDCPRLVSIDIRPGGGPNNINCQAPDSNGVIPVAVLTTPDFNATTVNPRTVIFEGAPATQIDKRSGQPRRRQQDVDKDGDIDLVFNFRLKDTHLTCDSLTGFLVGQTLGGEQIIGVDSIRIVPSSAPGLVAPPNGQQVSTGFVTLNWTATGGGACYYIQVDDDASFGSLARDAFTQETSYTVWSLEPGLYYWRVGASSGCSLRPDSWSDARSFRVNAPKNTGKGKGGH